MLRIIASESSFLIEFYFSSVCENPIYIEAREKLTKKHWIGSDSFLIHQVKFSKDWASGYSNDFG